jgi:hypothetical protein
MMLVNAVDDVVDNVLDDVVDVVLTALDASIALDVSIALDAPIALVIVLEEFLSYLTQKGDYLAPA